MAQIWPKKCVDCGVNVEYNGDEPKLMGFGPCKKRPGKHRVESLAYYHSGARDIQDVRDRRRFAPQIVLKQGESTSDPVTGVRKIITPALLVQFQDGKYETADPELQFLLDQRLDIASGPEGEQMWREIYLSPDQMNSIMKAENAQMQDVNRKLREDNALLESVKKNTRDGKPVSA